MPEFQPDQPVRVRDEGGDPDSQPEKRLLGKEGTIERGTVSVEAGATAYFVGFESGEVRVISGDWLEPR